MWIFRKGKDHIGLETLSEYLDGRLSASQAQELEGHLEACSMCVQELESLRETVGLLRQVRMLEPRRVFTVGAAPSRAPARPLFRVPTWAYGAAASVAVLFFALVTTADLGGLLAGEAASQDGSNLASEVPVESTPQATAQAQPTQLAPEVAATPSAKAPQQLSARAPQTTVVPEEVQVAQEPEPVSPPVVNEPEVSDQTTEEEVAKPVADDAATAMPVAPPLPEPLGTPPSSPPHFHHSFRWGRIHPKPRPP